MQDYEGYSCRRSKQADKGRGYHHVSGYHPGRITKIGLKSMMDPRVDGGCMNEKAKNAEPLVELIELQGEEWLWYKLPKLDVTLIRGTVADTKGNISCYKEGYKLGQLSAAEAARAEIDSQQ